MIMMMASSASSSLVAASDEDDRVSANGFSPDDNYNINNSSIRHLEEGRQHNKNDNSKDGCSTAAVEESSARQLDTSDVSSSQREAVALLAFNKARFEQHKSSSSSSSTSGRIVIGGTSKNNISSRTTATTSSSSASVMLPSDFRTPQNLTNNDDGVHKNNASKTEEAPSKPPRQHSPGGSSNNTANDIDEISLNSDDLQNTGGFDGSMSSDFLKEESSNKLKTNNNRHRPNSSSHSNSSSNNRLYGSRKSNNFSHSNGNNDDNNHHHNGRRIKNNYKSSSDNNNIKTTVTTVGHGRRIRHSSSSITSTGSSESNNHNNGTKIMSSLSGLSLSGLFNPISKRRQQQQQRNTTASSSPLHSSSATTSYNNKSFGLVRNNNGKQEQMQQQQQRLRQLHHQQNESINHNSSFDNSSWKGSSATGSILNPMKKNHSRVSWQIRHEDLEEELALSLPGGGGGGAAAAASKPNINNTSSSSSKKNSSWTITDLESLMTNSPTIGGCGDSSGSGGDALFQIGSSSAKSVLTPIEQQLWASMLQLATLNEVNGDHVGGTDYSLPAKSIQDAMSLAAAAVLQTDPIVGGDASPRGTKGVKPSSRSGTDGDRVESMELNRAKSSAAPTIEESSSLNQHPLQSSSPLPSQAPPPQLSTEITLPSTEVAVTTLAYQEVEDYRERLRRKREEMEGIDSSFTSQQQQPSPTDLNAILLENATNINNAVLLQRALYALRIHRGSLTGGNNAIDASSNVIGDASGDRTTSSTSDDQNPSRSNSLLCIRSRSEHSGLDQLALNHFLTLSSSVRSSGTAGSGSNNNSTWGGAAQAAAASLAGNDQPPSPFSSIVGQQRHSDLVTPQVGAYHQNEPAPLLFRRTFAHPNRRENRQATRRATLDILQRQRMSNATDGSSVGEEEEQQYQPHYQNDGSLEVDLVGSLNSDHQSNNEQSENMDEEFANSLQYSPTHHHTAADNSSITAQVTPYNPDDEGYNRRLLGTLLESTQSQQSTSSMNSNPRNILLTAQASVRRQSLRARQMIHAVLVSDEVVQAVEAEHIPNGDRIVFPNDLEQMDMMEELLEEKEEEVRMTEERYRRREQFGWLL